jgi:hypothetical protein
MRSRDAVLALLREQAPLIAPSMLKCDFGNLHREVEQLESAGAALLHLDVMDDGDRASAGIDGRGV